MTRYDRQERIEHWNQDAILKSKVLVAGDGLVSELVVIGMAGMGFGDIEYFCQRPSIRLGQSNAAELSQKINSDVKLLFTKVEAGKNTRLLGEYHAVIDATNNPGSKMQLMEWCEQHHTPYISASAGNSMGGMGVYHPPPRRARPSRRQEERQALDRENSLDQENQNSKTRDTLKANMLFLENAYATPNIDASGVMAGLAIEEARKIIAPIGRDSTLDDVVLYYPESRPHFIRHDPADIRHDPANFGPGTKSETGSEIETPRQQFESNLRSRNKSNNRSNNRSSDISHGSSIKSLKVAVVGAGALGTSCGLNLTLSGIAGIDLYDFDEIEEHNLTRQFLFYEKIGEQKSKVLKDRLSELGSPTRIRGINKKVSLQDIDDFKKYDVIIDCVDSFKTRALLNYISRVNHVPLISGGTSHIAGQVLTCKDACLDCQFAINDKASRSVQAARCIYAPTPSVVTSNMIIGFMQAACAKNLATLTDFDILKYVSTEELRLAEIPAIHQCACTPEKLKPIVEGFYRGQ